MLAKIIHWKCSFPFFMLLCAYAASLFLFSGCSEEEIAPAIAAALVEQNQEADGENDSESYEPPGVENDRQNEEPEAKKIPEEIYDPERSPDTILATVGEEKIVLQDIYDEFNTVPATKRQELKIQQHRLLESLVEEKMMTFKAKELGIDDTEIYKETKKEIKNSPMAEHVDKEQLETIALMEALLLTEVVGKADLSEERLQEVFSHYKHFLPADLGFEEVKAEIKKLMVRDQITQYIQSLEQKYSVEIDTDWVKEKKAEFVSQKDTGNNNGGLSD